MMLSKAIYTIVKPTALSLFIGIFLLGSDSFFEKSNSYAGAIYREMFFAVEDAGIRWTLFICLTVCCCTFCLLMSRPEDLLIMSLWFWALMAGFTGSDVQLKANELILVAGATLGTGIRFFFTMLRANKKLESGIHSSQLFLILLIAQLAAASLWHLDLTRIYYHGARWMGLWDNPNTYGILMGAGTTIAIGLLARMKKEECRMKKWQVGLLFISVLMLGVGLVMSYSRGAWVATSVSLLYLACCYGKLKWRYVAVGVGLLALGAGLVWGSTHDSAPWYVKRADLGRPSAQNRVIAWRAGLEIMRDHPLGVGWNNAVKLYGEKYSPPEGGPAAITTNDYLMLGTELGIPALVCFVAYVGLCLRGKGRMQNEECRIQAACRAGALVFVVAFWFDGGLFKLPTAAMFWVLLELGAARGRNEGNEDGKLIMENGVKAA